MFSPIALEFNAVLKDLPISLCISIVLPDCLPKAASLLLLDDVEPGNIEYSAVNHPIFFPFKKRGAPLSILAVHNTQVFPNLINADPSELLV